MNDFATDVQILEHYLHNLTVSGIEHPAEVRAAMNRLYAEAFMVGGANEYEQARAFAD